jgi:hypothetical protein
MMESYRVLAANIRRERAREELLAFADFLEALRGCQ